MPKSEGLSLVSETALKSLEGFLEGERLGSPKSLAYSDYIRLLWLSELRNEKYAELVELINHETHRIMPQLEMQRIDARIAVVAERTRQRGDEIPGYFTAFEILKEEHGESYQKSILRGRYMSNMDRIGRLDLIYRTNQQLESIRRHILLRG